MPSTAMGLHPESTPATFPPSRASSGIIGTALEVPALSSIRVQDRARARIQTRAMVRVRMQAGRPLDADRVPRISP